MSAPASAAESAPAASRPARAALPLALLALGVAVGVLAADVLRPAPVFAQVTDRTEKFVMFTSDLALGDPTDGVFVLDTVNGAIYGGRVGPTGNFVTSYGRNVAGDFGQRKAGAEYAVVSGTSEGGTGVIYVGENRSGKVIAYAVPDGRGANITLQPVATFNFRAPIQ